MTGDHRTVYNSTSWDFLSSMSLCLRSTKQKPWDHIWHTFKLMWGLLPSKSFNFKTSENKQVGKFRYLRDVEKITQFLSEQMYCSPLWSTHKRFKSTIVHSELCTNVWVVPKCKDVLCGSFKSGNFFKGIAGHSLFIIFKIIGYSYCTLSFCLNFLCISLNCINLYKRYHTIHTNELTHGGQEKAATGECFLIRSFNSTLTWYLSKQS